MKIQRYLARDMRTALAQVREQLGPDAVILSTGKDGDEVEVVAAIDLESQRGSIEPDPREQRAAAPQRAAQANGAAHGGAAVRNVDFSRGGDAARGTARRASSQLSPEITQSQQALREPAAEHSLAEEVKGMRRMLEAQLATLTWNDMTRRSPLQAAMLKELARIGLSNELASSLRSEEH